MKVSIKNLSDLKRASFNDKLLVMRIAKQMGVYILYKHSDYVYLSNFLKYRYGIVVRQGFCFCNNNHAVVCLLLFTDVPRSHVVFTKGVF